MITAKLFIRGSRDPLEITEEQGKKANQIKKGEGEYAGLTDKDTISIGDIWTGEKGDLRYVKFEGSIDKVEKVYSSKELFSFAEEIKPYCIQEGDDDFKRWVDLLVNNILDVKSKMFWNRELKNLLIGVRNKLDKFPSLNDWDKGGVQEQGKKEEDDLYAKRVQDAYDVAHMNSLGKELEGKKDIIRGEVEQVVKTRLVGTLSQKGREKYLQDQGAISITEEGRISIIKNSDDSIPYEELDEKLSEFSKWKARSKYAVHKQMEGYEEMSRSLANDKTLGYEEHGNAEPF